MSFQKPFPSIFYLPFIISLHNPILMQTEKFLSLVDEVIKGNVSDLHITGGKMPYIRNKIGDIVPVESYGVIDESEVLDIAEMLLERSFEESTVDV